MLIKDNLDTKELKSLVDKLINLLYFQASEIDYIHYKLYKLEGNYDKALDVLSISKNIDEGTKDKLRKEIENAKEVQKEIEEGLLSSVQHT